MVMTNLETTSQNIVEKKEAILSKMRDDDDKTLLMVPSEQLQTIMAGFSSERESLQHCLGAQVKEHLKKIFINGKIANEIKLQDELTKLKDELKDVAKKSTNKYEEEIRRTYTIEDGIEWLLRDCIKKYFKVLASEKPEEIKNVKAELRNIMGPTETIHFIITKRLDKASGASFDDLIDHIMPTAVSGFLAHNSGSVNVWWTINNDTKVVNSNPYVLFNTYLQKFKDWQRKGNADTQGNKFTSFELDDMPRDKIQFIVTKGPVAPYDLKQVNNLEQDYKSIINDPDKFKTYPPHADKRFNPGEEWDYTLEPPKPHILGWAVICFWYGLERNIFDFDKDCFREFKLNSKIGNFAQNTYLGKYYKKVIDKFAHDEKLRETFMDSMDEWENKIVETKDVQGVFYQHKAFAGYISHLKDIALDWKAKDIPKLDLAPAVEILDKSLEEYIKNKRVEKNSIVKWEDWKHNLE